ncbi:MAG: MATE family efflux transporter [Bacillota bacterium]|nr:MATE family efflux transporter [Bacillota bacterium]
MKTFEKDLSKGNVAKQMILFALPFLLSNFIQSLYNVADMIIVGNMSGTLKQCAESMSGVNIGSQLTFNVTNAIIGLCVGGTVLIGQYMGSNQRKELEETVETMFTALILLAAVASILVLIFKNDILVLLRTPKEAFNEASDYMSITMLGTIFIFAYNALSAVMRGMGDSKNPLKFVTIACCVNVVLDIILVKGFGMRAKGAALATVISQALSVMLCIIYLEKNNFVFKFRLSSFKINKVRLKMLLKIGVPTSVQNVVTGLSFLFLTALVNNFGVDASAALGAVSKFNGFGILPAVAMSSSISAMSAQNIGAGEVKRAQKTMQIGLSIALFLSSIVWLLAYLYPEPVLKIFSQNPDVVKAGTSYIKYFKFDYLIVPFIFSLNGLYIGSGHTMFSLINNICSAVIIRVPVSFVLGITFNLGLEGMGMAAPIASGTSAVIALIYFFTGRWKNSTIIDF